ncbi:MAG: WD40 repeat domain-containing protein [Thermoguttaceae bacterium]|nr:WD40 repeat domain-containing protein [Thermoguttaceae bacterium]
MDNEKTSSQQSDENHIDSESEVINIDSADIFHADPMAIYIRLMFGGLYLLCGFAIIFITLFLFPEGCNYDAVFIFIGALLILISIFYFFLAWHKRTYRSFINEQGIGCSNSHDIPAHAWSEVDYVIQRLYYRGNPPSNGVWGVAPRRLDEDYVVVLKSGPRLFFGRRNLGHLSRFKPLIFYYCEQNGVEMKTQEIYYSRKIKAGSRLVPSILICLQALVPLVFLGIQGAVLLTDQTAEEISLEERFSWPIEFLPRKPELCNKVMDNGSVAPLDVRISSLYLTENGKEVVFGTDGGSLQLRDISTGAELGTIQNALLSAVIFTMTSRDNTMAIVRDFDNQLLVWDINKKKEVASLDVPNKYYQSVVFSADGSFLYFGDLEGRISVYNLKTDSLHDKFPQVFQNPVVYSYASRDGHYFLVGLQNNSVYIWNLFMNGFRGEPISLNLDSELICAEFTDDNKELGTLENNGTFRIWDYNIRQETFRRPLVEKDKVNVFTFSHDGKLIAYGTTAGSVYFMSIKKSRVLESLRVPGMESPTPILDLKFSADDKYLIVGTKYGIWQVMVDPEFRE